MRLEFLISRHPSQLKLLKNLLLLEIISTKITVVIKKYIKMKYLVLLITITFPFAIASAQTSPLGIWKTIDDETGEAKSHVEIYEQNGKFYGKIVQLLLKPADTKCDKCPGDKKDQLLIGMTILENLKPYKDYWKYGKILDPNNGSEYGCSIWFEDGNTDELKVRGKHWTGLYRTQTWYRVK